MWLWNRKPSNQRDGSNGKGNLSRSSLCHQNEDATKEGTQSLRLEALSCLFEKLAAPMTVFFSMATVDDIISRNLSNEFTQAHQNSLEASLLCESGQEEDNKSTVL